MTVNKTTTFEAAIRNDGGKLTGCIGIVEPLYGSGPLHGTMKDGTVTLAVSLNGFEILFRAKSENGKIEGTYTVGRPNTADSALEKGEFSLGRMASKALLIRPCPTDAEMNAKDHDASDAQASETPDAP